MEILIVLGLLLCHFIGDFSPLSTKEMLAAKKYGDPLRPIVLHALVHGFLMVCFLALFPLKPFQYMIIFMTQMVTHFFIDLGKGKLQKKYPFLVDTGHKYYWWVFAMDQYLHIVFVLLIAQYLI